MSKGNIVTRAVKVIVGIIIAVLALFLIAYASFAITGAVLYKEARAMREYVCTIPETNSGFAPQGITYVAERDRYILTGYGSDNAAQMYLVKDKEYARVKLLDEDGSELKGHAGGVTCTDKYVYITGDAELLMFELDKIIEAPEDGVTVFRKIAVDNNASYCYSDDDNIYVGEFYREQNYKTDENHHYTTPGGAQNKAIVSCYNKIAFETAATLDTQPYPLYCISLPDLVQGFAISGDTIILSRSYGLKDSALDFHSDKALAPLQLMDVTFKNNADANKAKVALYYVDDSTLDRTLTLPAFSEDITVVGDKVIVTNESCTNKYFVGKLFGANKVYSYPIRIDQ